MPIWLHCTNWRVAFECDDSYCTAECTAVLVHLTRGLRPESTLVECVESTNWNGALSSARVGPDPRNRIGLDQKECKRILDTKIDSPLQYPLVGLFASNKLSIKRSESDTKPDWKTSSTRRLIRRFSADSRITKNTNSTSWEELPFRLLKKTFSSMRPYRKALSFSMF